MAFVDRNYANSPIISIMRGETNRPLADLTSNLMGVVPSGDTLRDLEDIHRSVSFLELPEMRDEWVRRIHSLLCLAAHGKPDAPWLADVKKVWDEFFFGRK